MTPISLPVKNRDNRLVVCLSALIRLAVWMEARSEIVPGGDSCPDPSPSPLPRAQPERDSIRLFGFGKR